MVTDPDQVAFESAQKIAGMTGEYRSQVVAKIQVEVRAAMAALSLAPATLTGTVRPEAVAAKGGTSIERVRRWLANADEAAREETAMLAAGDYVDDGLAEFNRDDIRFLLDAISAPLSNPEAPAAPVVVACSTCGGTGSIDQSIGGYPLMSSEDCPDCIRAALAATPPAPTSGKTSGDKP